MLVMSVYLGLFGVGQRLPAIKIFFFLSSDRLLLKKILTNLVENCKYFKNLPKIRCDNL